MTDSDTPTDRKDDAAGPDARAEDAPIDVEFEEAAPPPPPPRPRRRRAGGFVWGLFFAVILLGAGAAGAVYFDLGSRLPGLAGGADGAEDGGALEERIAALEARPAPAAPEPVDLSGVEGRLAALESGAQARSDALTGLTERIAALEARPAPGPAASAPAPAADAGALDDLQDEIAALRQEMAGQRAEMAQLRERAAEAPPPDGDASALAGRVAALEDAAPDQERLQDRLDDVESRLAGLDAAAETGVSRRAVAALEARIAALESQTPASRGEAAYRFAALREAAARGAPFADQHAALARLRPDDADLAAIADTAATGAPSIEELRRSYPAGAIREAAADAPEPEGRFAWLQRMADNVATVRREDQAQGPTDQAVAEAQAALDAGDLAAAVAATETLAGPAAEAAAYWLDRARGRLRLNARIAAIQESLSGEAEQ